MKEIESILREFADKIETAVRSKTLANLGLGPQLTKVKGKVQEVLGEIKKRRKGPKQLCPAPGCKTAAAPVFGMLCAKHKGTAKVTVAKWREARRAKQAKVAKAKTR